MRFLRWAIVTAMALTISLPILAAQEFEVASLKQDQRLHGPLNAIDINFQRGLAAGARNGRLSLSAISLRLLIELAYDLKDAQLLGGPSWLDNDRYDLEARADGTATFDEMRPMLRALLVERCKLTLRRETRTVPIYELHPARGGLKIGLAADEPCTAPGTGAPSPLGPVPGPVTVCGGVRRQIVNAFPDRLDRIEATRIGMSRLIEILSNEVGRTVVDRTGVTVPVSLRLEFAPNLASFDTGPGFVNASPSVAPGLSIFTALQEQLGMRLASAEGPVDVFVIDRVERPSGN